MLLWETTKDYWKGAEELCGEGRIEKCKEDAGLNEQMKKAMNESQEAYQKSG